MLTSGNCQLGIQGRGYQDTEVDRAVGEENGTNEQSLRGTTRRACKIEISDGVLSNGKFAGEKIKSHPQLSHSINEYSGGERGNQSL